MNDMERPGGGPASTGSATERRYVIMVVGAADGRPTSYDGEYVREYDPDWGGGLGRVWTTRNLNEAILFKAVAGALRFWKQQSKERPLRPDGKPNRPLTAFTIETIPVDVEGA